MCSSNWTTWSWIGRPRKRQPAHSSIHGSVFRRHQCRRSTSNSHQGSINTLKPPADMAVRVTTDGGKRADAFITAHEGYVSIRPKCDSGHDSGASTIGVQTHKTGENAMSGASAFWGWMGLGGFVFLCYAGHVLYMWAQERFPNAKKSCWW